MSYAVSYLQHFHRPQLDLKEPKLSWLTGFLKSSVGRKFVMAITGLFLCFFLVVHLAGNLLLYVGPEAYENYAHKLHSNEELLMIAETLLFGAFGLHILLAFSTARDNFSGRSKGYRSVESKRDNRALPLSFAPDYTMMITGLVGLLFLCFHVADFKFEAGWEAALEGKTEFYKVGVIVAHQSRVILYILGSVALGIHVSHGLASACQTIGLNHPKYTPTIHVLSKLFGIVVALGFSSFPIAVHLYPQIFQAAKDAADTLH